MDQLNQKKRTQGSTQLPRWFFVGVATFLILLAGACRPTGTETVEEEETNPTEPSTGKSEPESVAETETQGAALLEKMRGIIIPKLEFQNTPFRDAIAFLVHRSRELDPEGTGINVIFGEEFQETGTEVQITLDVSNIPLSEALRYAAELANVKVTLEEHAVLLSPGNGRPAQNASVFVDPAVEEALMKKLETLIVPAVEFQDTPFTDALSFLRDRSFALDIESPEEQRGLNLILAVPPDSGIDVENLKVSLNLKDIPLGEALNYTAKLAGLEFRVEGDVVVISAPDSR